MQGYAVVNLKHMLDEMGEDETKRFLSDFSCPLNADVEDFLKFKAIEFSGQGLAQTHLVMASYRDKPVLVGYFALANKYISVNAGKISKTTKKRINKFSIWQPEIKKYYFSAPLIGQLGKNFTNGYNKLISGDELLDIACNKVKNIQMDLGGRFVYLECEDKPKLIDFYAENGFCEFDRRPLDRDETDLSGDYLVQMLKYLK